MQDDKKKSETETLELGFAGYSGEVIAEIEEKIGYSFQNKRLLQQAFTRSSFAMENESEDNEVLEFIGDSVIGMFVVKQLSNRYTWKQNPLLQDFTCELDEGELSALKMRLVQSSSLASITERLGLERYLRMGKGDVLSLAQTQTSVKEDLLEAIVGAIAIDSNWNIITLEKVVADLMNVDALLEKVIEEGKDDLARLNEWFEKNNKKLIFEQATSICKNLKYGVSVCLGMEMLNYVAYGYGATEKEAHQMAAKRAMDYIEKVNDRATAINKAVGQPCLERAVNQLQELNQKKLIPPPEYVFTQRGKTETGNPQWECCCNLAGIVENRGGYVCSSKPEAKRQAAYETLLFLVGKDLTETFTLYGTEVSQNNKNIKGDMNNERN